MKYDQVTVQKIADAIGRNKFAYEWLRQEGRLELCALVDAFLTNNQDALNWLSAKKEMKLLFFFHACHRDRKALDALIKAKKMEWVAVASVVNNDRKALRWLHQHKLEAFANLAAAIDLLINEDNYEDDCI